MEISVKKEELSKKSIFVATPMYGGMNHGLYAKACLDLQAICIQYGIQVKFSFLFNESLITRARNYLVDEFIHRSDCTHLLFLDSDISFNPQDVIALLALDKDVIGGPYPKKAIKWRSVKKAVQNNPDIEPGMLEKLTGDYVFNPVKGTAQFSVTEPLEVLEIGTGFMLIKREVFDKLKDLVPTYKNDVHDLGNTLTGQEEIKEYFATSIEPETQRLLSEDYHFCYIWRKAGGKVFAAPWAVLTHNGMYSFEGRLIPSP